MKKIKGLDTFFDNASQIDQGTEAKINDSILKIFGDLNPENFSKKNLYSLLVITLGVILSGILIIIFFMLNSYPSLYVGIVAIVLTGVAVFMWSQNKRNWFDAVNARISFDDLCKTYFETRYENVKVLGKAEIDKNMMQAHKGEGVPSDATILEYQPGVAFSADGIQVHTGQLVWHWYRTTTDGKRTYTQEYRTSKFITYVPRVPERWSGFELSFAMGGFFGNKGHELENEKFNKLFSYTHNDPIRLRILFTPLIQEIFTNFFMKTSSANTFIFDLSKNQLITSKTSMAGNPFAIDRISFGKKEIIAKNIYKELRDDFNYLEEQISIITTLRELIIDR